MKKLTAGIFATLLTVVSVGAANASIASKGYVDQQVGTKADKATVSSLQGTVAGKADKATTLAGYGITDGATKTELSAKADSATVTALDKAAEKIANRVTTVSDASDDAHYPTAKAVWDIVQEETADIASTADLTKLEGRVDTAEGDIDSIQGTIGTYGNIVTKNASDFATAAQGAKADTALQKSGELTQGHLLTTDASGNIVDAGAKGALASKNTVSAAEIAANAVTTEKILDANVTKAKLASDVQTSLGKADSALQQAALADYAKTADVASTYETKENAASTYETKANASATYETKTNASATYETKTNAAATYATKEEIAGMATDANLALKQDKTDNSLATTNKTVVGAINEVKTTADGANTAAAAAQADATQALEDAAAAQTTADAAIPKVNAEGSDGKYVLTATAANGVATYKWELIERGSAE